MLELHGRKKKPHCENLKILHLLQTQPQLNQFSAYSIHANAKFLKGTMVNEKVGHRNAPHYVPHRSALFHTQHSCFVSDVLIKCT